MRIGIDASRLTEFNRTGTENYLYNLVKELSNISTENKYILYFKNLLSDDFINDLIGKKGNIEFKFVPKKHSSWTQGSLALELLRFSPDVLFCPWHTAPLLGRLSTKFVTLVHDMSGSLFWTTAACRLSSHIIVVSESVKSDLKSKVNTKNIPISVIYEGVNTSLFKKQGEEITGNVLNKYDINSEYVLHVGTLNTRKNIINQLIAFEEVLKNKTVPTDSLFVLVGRKGNSFDEVMHYINSSPHRDNIKYLGSVSDAELLALITGSICLTYASTYEGFGLPILEAMSIGTPVITSNISSMPEIAGKAAYFVSPLSMKELKVAYTEMFNNSLLRDSLIELGYSRSASFSWLNTALQIDKLFTELNQNRRK
ncbi:MAG: glycosyltransferase family 4 protein [Patescibacteria group bacterium]